MCGIGAESTQKCIQRKEVIWTEFIKEILMLLLGLFDETGPPITVADRISASTSGLLNIGMWYRATCLFQEVDKYEHLHHTLHIPN